MANNLGGCVTKFTSNLDKIIEAESKTSFLNINGTLLGDFVGVGEVKVAKLAMDGLGDYDRAAGFVPGGVTLDWETRKLEFDRGREFTIDSMDDEEHERLVSANTLAEFTRTKVIPEMDAIRFARLAENAGTTAAEAYEDPQKALDAVLLMEECFQDHGKALSEVTLCLTSGMKTLLRKSQPWRIGQGEAPNGNFETFDDMRLNVIPSARFYTAIDLLDGKSSGEATGGYKKAESGAAINFLGSTSDAAQAIQKHEKLRYFPPDTYQKGDMHCWQYRVFHDLIVLDNKKPLIYCSHMSA